MLAAKNGTRNGTRSISGQSNSYNTQNDVYELTIAPKSLETVCNKIINEIKNLPHLKQLGSGALESINKDFIKELKKSDPKLLEELEYIKHTKPLITSITGINFPKFNQAHFPKNFEDLNNQSFMKEIRPAEIIISALTGALGIEPEGQGEDSRLIGYVFSQKIDSGELTSNNKGLDWHNDGWQYLHGLPQSLALLGVVGQKNVLTEVVTSKQIIKYLEDNNQKDLIKALGNEHFMGRQDEYYEIFFPIIDKDQNMHFASRAVKNMIDKEVCDNSAAVALANLLKTITPAFSKALDAGDLLVVRNDKVLHSRKIDVSSQNEETPPSNNVEKFSGNRLLTRVVGSQFQP